MVLPPFDSKVVEYMKAMDVAARRNLITMIHCEDYGLVQYLTQRLIEEGHQGVADYANARPELSEVIAGRRAIAMAEVTRSQLYIVHIASKTALDVVIAAKAAGLPVFAETWPIHLVLPVWRI
jgi:dihydropyrimidinase